MKAWLLVAAMAGVGCEVDDPPTFYGSPDLRGPIAIGDDAIYFVESNRSHFTVLAELGLDGIRRGLVTEDVTLNGVEVRGATLAWIRTVSAHRRGPRGDEAVVLPSGDPAGPNLVMAHQQFVLTDDGMFFAAEPLNDFDGTVIFYWGDVELEQLPIAPDDLRLVGADATSVYVVLPPHAPNEKSQLVRYVRSGGAIEPIAEGVKEVTVTEDTILYATEDALFERELTTGIERRLHDRPGGVGGFLVASGGVIFWGNRRIMDGHMEEFLLSDSSDRFMQGVEVKGNDVYWLTRAYARPTLIGEDPGIRLHRAAIHGPRPF